MASRKTTFLPASLRAYLKRTGVRLWGVMLVGLATFIFGALMTYHQADPSINTASTGAPTNMFGYTGAATADFLWQTIGMSAFLMAGVLVSWGLRIMLLREITWMSMRTAALPLSLILFSAFSATLPLSSEWSLASGRGGFIGDLLLLEILPVLSFLGAFAKPLLGLIFLGTGLPLALWSAGLSEREWEIVFKALHRGGELMMATARRVGNYLYEFSRYVALRAYNKLRSRNKPTNRLALAPVKRKAPKLDLVQDMPDAIGDDDDSTTDIILPQKAAKALRINRERPATQQRMEFDGEFRLPPLDLLTAATQRVSVEISKEALEQNARLLESVLNDFGILGEITAVRPGPVVTLYELEPAAGVKSSRVISLADDIARSMSAVSARVAVIPGRNVIGIELPNAERETVFLREVLETAEYESATSSLPLALGKDIGGSSIVADLAKMPHLLVAGTTGSGKSVAINVMILSLLFRFRPEECRIILIDPKMLELSVYDGIPHLLSPVVTEPKKAVVALKWCVREMENRYKAMSQLGVRNITNFNTRLRQAKARGETLTRRVQTSFDEETGRPVYEDQALELNELPQIVVVVDEMADLMLVAGKDIEAMVQRLAQMARAAGIHIIMATQRPSVDVITGTIKANFPTRMSFQVTSKIDSRTILGEQGAEQLLGQGDMLYMSGGGRILRVHGPFVSDTEVEKVVEFLRSQAEPAYIESVTEDADAEMFDEGSSMSIGEPANDDQLYDQAVMIVTRDRKASISYIQRRLRIGYNKAATLMERMEEQGVVSRASGTGKRDILVGEA